MYMGDRKDTVEHFIYPIDVEEVQRIARNLINVNEPDERDAFLAFSSVGRHIYVNSGTSRRCTIWSNRSR